MKNIETDLNVFKVIKNSTKSKTHAAWLCTALDTKTARKRILEQTSTWLDFNANAQAHCC